MFHNVTSPTRRYMAVIATINGEHAFKQFTLPNNLTNDSGTAEWFYVNRLDLTSVIFGVVTYENYMNMQIIPQNAEGHRTDI